MLGVGSSSLQVSSTTPGRAKQARLSTWPSVSSVVDAAAEPDAPSRRRGSRAAPARSARGVSSGLRLRVEQALFGRQHRALAVDVDRAALEHDRRPVAVGALDLEHLGGDPFVAVPGRVEAALGPPQALKCQSTPRRPPSPSTTKVGPVSRIQASSLAELDDPDRRRQQRAAALELGVGDRHRHRLGGGDRLGHRGEGLLRGLGAQAPVVRPLRPGHPAAAVRLELGRHAVAVGGRGRVDRRLISARLPPRRDRAPARTSRLAPKSCMEEIRLITRRHAARLAAPGTRPPQRAPFRIGAVQQRWHPDPDEHEAALAAGDQGSPPARARSWSACRS